MAIVATILLVLGGLGLILFGLGYSAAFLAARKFFERALASQAAEQGKTYIADAIAGIKSGFVRRILQGRLGAMAGSAAVGLVRGELSAGIKRGLMLAALGLCCIIASFYVPTLLAMIWPAR